MAGRFSGVLEFDLLKLRTIWGSSRLVRIPWDSVSMAVRCLSSGSATRSPDCCAGQIIWITVDLLAISTVSKAIT